MQTVYNFNENDLLNKMKEGLSLIVVYAKNDEYKYENKYICSYLGKIKGNKIKGNEKIKIGEGIIKDFIHKNLSQDIKCIEVHNDINKYKVFSIKKYAKINS